MNHKYAYELLFQVLTDKKGEIDAYRYCEIVKFYELTHPSKSKQIQVFYQNMLNFKPMFKEELDERAEKARKERFLKKYSTKKINYYIERYIASGKNMEDFVENTKISIGIFQEMIKMAKEKNLSSYEKFLEHKKEKTSEQAKKIIEFANEILEYLSKPETTELDCLINYNFNKIKQEFPPSSIGGG